MVSAKLASRSGIMLGAGISCLAASAVVASGATWTGSVDNSFHNAGNWNPGTPGSADDAVFNLGSASPYTVTVTSAVTNANLEVQNDKLGFDIDTGSNPAITYSATNIRLAPTAGQVASFTLSDGTLKTASASGTNSYVGGAGTGELIVTGAGSRFEGAHFSTVASSTGKGTVKILDGGAMVLTGSFIANYFGGITSSSAISVDGIHSSGARSTLSVNGALYAGRAYTGSVGVTNGGLVRVKGQLLTGFSGSYTGTFTVDGVNGSVASTIEYADLIGIGGSSVSGVMEIKNGGTVIHKKIDTFDLTVAAQARVFGATNGTRTGVATITGSGSRWDIYGGTGVAAGLESGLVIGDNKALASSPVNGTVTIADTAIVNVRGHVAGTNTTSTTVKNQGGTLIRGGGLLRLDDGTLNTGGGEQIRNGGRIEGSGNFGRSSATGTGLFTLVNTGTVSPGLAAAAIGTLDIANGNFTQNTDGLGTILLELGDPTVTQYDRILADEGTVTIVDGTIDLSRLGGYTNTIFGNYDLISGSTVSVDAGIMAAVLADAQLLFPAANTSVSIIGASGSGQALRVSVSAVPEPGAIGLLLLSGAPALGRRRKRS